MLKVYLCSYFLVFLSLINILTMKIFTSILVVIAFALIGFNIYIYSLDHSGLFSNKNSEALIGIVASICAVLILLIFKLSKKIEERSK